MPGKHNAGGCGCCGCPWYCGAKLSSVQVDGATVSGNACCDHPDGTFVVGAASGGGYNNGTGRELNTNNANAYFLQTNNADTYSAGCRYSWEKAGNLTCHTETIIRYSQNYTYTVAMARCAVYADWSPTLLRVIIMRQYLCTYSGNDGIGPVSGTIADLSTTDIYSEANPDCNALPEALSLTTELASLVYYYDNGETPRSPVTSTDRYFVYGYDENTGLYNLFRFDACDGDTTIDLTYA